jgi:hypothetical protein
VKKSGIKEGNVANARAVPFGSDAQSDMPQRRDSSGFHSTAGISKIGVSNQSSSHGPL